MSQRGRIGSCSIRVCLYLKLGCFVHQFCLFFSCIRFWFFKTRCIRRHHSFDTLTLCTCEVSLAPLPQPRAWEPAFNEPFADNHLLSGSGCQVATAGPILEMRRWLRSERCGNLPEGGTAQKGQRQDLSLSLWLHSPCFATTRSPAPQGDAWSKAGSLFYKGPVRHLSASFLTDPPGVLADPVL